MRECFFVYNGAIYFVMCKVLSSVCWQNAVKKMEVKFYLRLSELFFFCAYPDFKLELDKS